MKILDKSPCPTRRISSLMIAFLLIVSLLPLIAIISEPAQASPTENNLNVTWKLIQGGIVHKVWEIEVQNPADMNRRVDLSTLFSDTSFPIDQLRNVEFYEWKGLWENRTFWFDNENAPIYGGYYETLEDGDNVWVENTDNIIGLNQYSEIFEVKVNQWKLCKMSWVKAGDWNIAESINIPPLGSKAKEDNFGSIETENGTKKFKIEFDVPVTETPKGWGSSGKVALVIDNAEYHPIWSDGWAYKKKITIDCSKVEDNLDNFPVLVSWASDSDLADHALDNGDDIAFVNLAETWQFDHEIEYFDGSTGQLIAHVRIFPTLYDNENVEVWMFYGNPDASPQENPTGVWDDNFVMVQHMDDYTTSSILDSTSYNNDGTKKAANEPIENDGKIGKAQDFDGENDHINLGTALSSHFHDHTSEYWIKPAALDDWMVVLGIADWKQGMRQQGQNMMYSIMTSEGWTGLSTDTNPINQIDVWYHVVLTFIENGTIKIYVNGAEEKSGSTTGTTNLAGLTTFISSSVESIYWMRYNGEIDEVRHSNIARSSGWIKTTFNNEDDPASFYTVGGEESAVFPPDKPELVKPVENQPRFEWTEVNAENYRLLVDDDIDFSSPCENRVLIENYYQIPAENALENGVYYWKVIARNEMGENSSDVWSFVVGAVGEAGVDENLYVAMAIAALAAGIGVIIWARGIAPKEESKHKTKMG